MMQTVLHSLIAFIPALIILITVHEYGHFFLARLCGVKVLRFALGFGKPLLRYQGRNGTEFIIAACPIGGYVKMLDEREAFVAPHERHMAFNHQSVWARIAIVLAGPLANFLFAVLAYWAIFCLGFTTVTPIVGKVEANSIAAVAGLKPQDKIIELNNHATSSWREVRFTLLRELGSRKKMFLTISRENNDLRELQLDLKQWHVDTNHPNPIQSLGIHPFVPLIPPVIAKVLKNKPAEKAGLKVGDKILTINKKPIQHWKSFATYIRVHPEKLHQLEVERQGKIINVAVKAEDGLLGIRSHEIVWPRDMLHLQRENLLNGAWKGLKQTLLMTHLSFVMIAKLFTGSVSFQHVSGPIGIAKGAGQSASFGISAYLGFLALVSVSLAVLNILPIPMLDGGHLVYYLLEIIRGRPVPLSVQESAMKIGMIFLIILMVVALYNDITRIMS